MIRTATERDICAINDLSADLGYPRMPTHTARARLAQLLRSNTDKVWVMDRNGRLVAWIHVFISRRMASAAFCEIGGIAVAQDQRRKGLGKQLVEYSLQWAESQNMPLRVRTNTQRDGADKFYAALGLSLLKTQSVFQSRQK